MPTYTANTLDFHVELAGNESADTARHTIVFLHGLGSSTKDWQAQVEAFSDEFICVAIDLRGHGRSAKPDGPYSIEQMADDVARIVPQITSAAVHVIGLSMGAQVAMQLALDHPMIVNSIVAVNSPANMKPGRFKDKLKVLQRKLLVRFLGMRKVGVVLGKRLLPDEESDDLRDAFAARFGNNDPAAYQASLNAILQWDVTERLPELSMPLLIVSSSDDYTPLQLKQYIVDTVPSAQLVVIDNSRHAVPIERPDAFNKILRAYLNAISHTVHP